MTAKCLLPNQHVPLHFFYGPSNCCLCQANQKIVELEARIKELEKTQELDPEGFLKEAT